MVMWSYITVAAMKAAQDELEADMAALREGCTEVEGRLGALVRERDDALGQAQEANHKLKVCFTETKL